MDPLMSRMSTSARSATRRRVVVGILVVLSLALLSVYFRESSDGPLHGAQDVGATAIRPFQVGAERVARPFRDLYGWFDGLLIAKDENERLVKENARLRREAIRNDRGAGEPRPEAAARLSGPPGARGLPFGEHAGARPAITVRQAALDRRRLDAASG